MRKAMAVTMEVPSVHAVAVMLVAPSGSSVLRALLLVLRNVEGFVRACFVGDKQIKNRAASATARLIAAGGPPPRRDEKAVAVTKDTSAESVAPTLKALRAWLGTRPEGRMRSGEIDRFFNAHRGLPKPRGIKWLDQYLKQYGMRKRDSGNRSYFFIEVADGSAQ